MSKALSHQLSRDSLSSHHGKLGFRLGIGLVGLLAGLLSLSTPGLARAMCGDGVVDPGEQCEAPFGGCCNPTTCMIDLPAGEPDLRLRAIKDTRMMQRHQPANDGGAGIISF